jgi:hypothetical protein
MWYNIKQEKVMDRTDRINMLDWIKEDYKIDPGRLKPLYIECNTLDMEVDTELYRIMSYEMLIKTLQTKSLSMSKPKTYPDPYETFLMNYKARMKDGSIVGFNLIREKIYCQCWSLRKECEGLWKVHSKDEKEEYRYVKIKANANKLMKYFYDTNNIFHLITYFIGRVSYVEEEFILGLLNEGIGQYFTSMTSNMPMIYSLLIKRKAFEYEDEVRLIFDAPEISDINHSNVINKWDLTNNYFSFQIDINDVIEEITFHPYLEEEDCSKFEHEIKALGYKGKINHSNLYTREDKIFDF